jgi:H+/Cl- antiporter ClcA
MVSALFIELTHWLKRRCRVVPLPLRLAAGGSIVIGLWKLVGTSDYLGLGVPGILRAFSDPAFPAAGFALKLLFTAVTLGAGFLGGEVTPLFFMGAALGNVLGRLLGIPLPLAAGVGMAASFGAASNTPLALSIMAVELLGAGALPHVGIVCVVAYALSGNRSIYTAQLRRPKP